MLAVAEMLGHFSYQRPLDQRSGQLLQQTVFANQVFRRLVARE